MRTMAVISLFFFLTCASASSQALVVTFFPIVHAIPATIENADAARTTALDRTMHKQGLVHSEFARLNAPLSITDGNRTYTLAPDHLMFSTRRARGVFARDAEGGSSVSFCTYDTTFAGRNAIGRSMAMHTCLIDNDADGQFDLAYAAFGLDGLAGALIGDFGVRVPASTHYTRVAAEPRRVAELALKFSPPGAFSRPELRLALISERSERLVCGSFPIPRVLPGETAVRGAVIEATGIEDRVLSYRIKSGFDGADLPQLRLAREDNGSCG